MPMPLFKEHLQTLLMDFPEIALVYLFGSRIEGQIGPMSDCDLGVVGDSHG